MKGTVSENYVRLVIGIEAAVNQSKPLTLSNGVLHFRKQVVKYHG